MTRSRANAICTGVLITLLVLMAWCSSLYEGVTFLTPIIWVVWWHFVFYYSVRWVKDEDLPEEKKYGFQHPLLDELEKEFWDK